MRIDVRNMDMAPETKNFFTDLASKAFNNADSYDHDTHTQSHCHCGQSNDESRKGSFTSAKSFRGNKGRDTHNDKYT